jgi:histone-lysine N-methyltransferase MLL5
MNVNQDHTYGAPWPPSPPPSVVAPPMLAVPRVNGHIDIDNVSYHAEVCTTAVDIDPGNQYADSVTRCICGFLHDDGYMICCDKCGYGRCLLDIVS